MSASSKKKLRSAEQAAKMTEKQLTEQKEAKKLKTYSTLFVVVIALMVVFAVYTAVTNTVNHSGIFERKTVAVTVGDHEISNAEFNYYYIDSVNNFFNNYGSYASLFGLDVTKPLNEQVINEETGETWADDFMNSAKESIRAVYALADAANAHGFTLSEAELNSIDMQVSNMNVYATLYGYSNLDDYLKAMYGNGADEESFRNYVTLSSLASAYQSYYATTLSYEDADLRAAEAENYAQYSSFSFNSYFISTSKYLTGGTSDENGATTYSDEEREAARAAAEEAAKALTACTTAEELDAAIAAMPINKDVEGAASSAYTDVAYSGIISTISQWVTDEARQAGDIDYIEATTSTTTEDGTETKTVTGYYVVLFGATQDNNYPLANVRHILVGYENGTYDANLGVTVYSDEEKANAKAKAEDLLAAWTAGEATEDSFAALAKENSTDTGSAENGGLYEDVYPGQMVTNFNDWCFADERKAGDTGLVESDYGWHIMYYSGDSETMYRDFMIENTLLSEDMEAWYNALVEATVVTEKDTKYISKDLVLSAT